jgi:uncharacterized peroxidase-related enzyme
MPHLQPLSTDQAGPQARALFDAVEAKFRAVPNIFRTMGHAPAVLEHTLGMDSAILSDLDPKLRELAYLTASRINHCGYCEHYHKMAGKRAGLSGEQIDRVGVSLDEATFSPLERLVFRFADEWTRQGKASAEVVTALNQQLTPAQMVVLAAAVGLANWTNRFNETFGTQLP